MVEPGLLVSCLLHSVLLTTTLYYHLERNRLQARCVVSIYQISIAQPVPQGIRRKIKREGYKMGTHQ